jgi:putative lipoic acid-binding regulatory protein
MAARWVTADPARTGSVPTLRGNVTSTTSRGRRRFDGRAALAERRASPHIGPTMSEQTLLEFPTDFPIKVMGKADDDFRSLVVGILSRHFAGIDQALIEERPSSAGRYLGITVVVRAENKAQIDAAYTDLTSCQRVLVAL